LTSTAVLLGAGASVDAGIPTSVGMTDDIIGRVEDAKQVRILQFVRHTLAASLAQQEPRSAWDRQPVNVAVDVESLFASVELLIDRERQLFSPFVATWHPGFSAFSRPVRESSFFPQRDLERALDATGGGPRGAEQAAKGVAKFVNDAITRAHGGDVGEILSAARDSMLRSLFDVLHISDPESVRYLTPLVDLARSQGSLTIATLNYDRSIENAAELTGEPCDTGIETWLSRGALKWPNAGLRLLKLHGSIDWVFQPNQTWDELPFQQIRKVTPDEKRYYDSPAVVFGEAGKLRSEGPYLELLLAWATQLQEANRLVIVGYSFRDAHVNEVIARWFNADVLRRIVVLDPDDLEARSLTSFAGHVAHLAHHARRPDETAPRIVQIAATAKEGLPTALELGRTASAHD
jgi:hypothetical protein